MSTKVGEHDPIALSHPLLGNWIECECGWISNGFRTPECALAAHERHTTEATV